MMGGQTPDNRAAPNGAVTPMEALIPNPPAKGKRPLRTIAPSSGCVHRRPFGDVGTIAWARDLVRRPQCYGVDEHIRRIVAELLTEVCR
jgi:hypothetical protein